MVHEIALQLGNYRARLAGVRGFRCFITKNEGAGWGRYPLTGYRTLGAMPAARIIQLVRIASLLPPTPTPTHPPPLPPAARKFRHSGPARLLQREEQSRGRKNAAVTAYARGYRDDNSRGSASKLHTRLRGAPGFRLRREHPLDLQLELNDATPRAGP